MNHSFPFTFTRPLAKSTLCFALFLSFATSSRANGFEVIEIPDQIYYHGSDADADKHQLDLYFPESEESFPILIWIHGGAWAQGGRKDECELARRFAEAGVGVAAISYRLSAGPFEASDQSSKVRHPDHVRDGARAIAWLYRNRDKFNYDTNKLFVSGYSAGGHLSALLAMDTRYLASEGIPTSIIRGVIPISGTYKLKSYRDVVRNSLGEDFAAAHVDQAFGDNPVNLEQASPVSYLENFETPMLVISDGQLAMYTETLEAKLNEVRRTDVTVAYYRDHTHKTLHDELSSQRSPARDSIVEFIRQYQQ